MSTNRLGDIVKTEPLSGLALQATGGAGPVSGLASFRAAQLVNRVLGVTGGGGSDTLDLKLQESDPPKLLAQINAYDGTDDGSIKLREGAATAVELGIPFTPTADITVDKIRLQLSQLGSVAAGKKVWVTIETDSTGPSGTDVNGAQAYGASRKVEAADISDSIEEVEFELIDGVDLTASTTYWIIVKGDYTASATDCIQVHYNTVVGTSLCEQYDAAWGAIANYDIWYEVDYLEFTDISGAALTQVTEGWANPEDTDETLELSLKGVKDTVRLYATVSGGVWYPTAGLALGMSGVIPVS